MLLHFYCTGFPSSLLVGTYKENSPSPLMFLSGHIDILIMMITPSGFSAAVTVRLLLRSRRLCQAVDFCFYCANKRWFRTCGQQMLGFLKHLQCCDGMKLSRSCVIKTCSGHRIDESKSTKALQTKAFLPKMHCQ